LGLDCRRQPCDRVNTRFAWSHDRHARAWARHLAPIPQTGSAATAACRGSES
jgi:hypothetical protein